MYFLPVSVDKVTPAQITEARKIIPGLKMKPVITHYDALRVALAEMEPTLRGYHYFSKDTELEKAPQDGKFILYAHHYQPTENGWVIHLLVRGD